MALTLTLEEIVVQGLARVQDYASSFPAVRSVLYRRVGIRQQQLAAMAAKVNREFYGVAANAVVTAGAADVNDIGPPVPTPEMIERIEVGAVTVAPVYPVGTEVSIVRASDVTAEEPPRVTLRAGVLRQVAAELATVTSLKVYYSKLPNLPGLTGVDVTVIPEPHTELLVVDVAKVVLERSNLADVGKMPAYQALVDEEKAGMQAWLDHAAQWGATRSRFAR